MNEQNGSPELPKGWTWATIGEILTFEYGKALQADKRDSSGDFPVYGSNGVVGFHSEPLIAQPCIIIGRKGAAGKVHLSNKSSWAIDTTYFSIPSNNLNLTFCFYLLSTLNLGSFDRSTAIPGLNRDDAYAIKIPLPPLNEQARIVARIEELFTKLDAGIEALRAVKKQLKRYRQAVLRDAVTGELTAIWRKDEGGRLQTEEKAANLLQRILRERRERWEAEQLAKFAATGKTPKNDDWKNKYQKPAPPNTENLPELPNSWSWVSVIQIGFVISGQTPQGIENVTQTGDIRWYKVSDMNSAGNEKHMRKSSTFLTDDEVSKLKLNLQPVNTIIFPKRGGAIATNKKRILTESSGYDLNIMGILPFGVNHAYIWNWFASINLATLGDGSNVPQINHGDIEPLPVPLPPLTEQQKIVEEVERLLSVADAIEATIEQSLKQAARLRQSILKRAFAGKLVPQDETDEPATILLERIKLEREEKAKEAKAQNTKSKVSKASSQNSLPFATKN